MIEVTRMDNTKLIVSSDLIEFIEHLPETIISLTTGKKIMVQETVAEIVEKVVAFRKRLSNHEIEIVEGGNEENAGNND